MSGRLGVPGYEVSQCKRKRIEESFGWMKIIGLLKKVKLRGLDKVGWLFTFVGAAYNLYRPKAENGGDGMTASTPSYMNRPQPDRKSQTETTSGTPAIAL
jgi:hypothetical protein